MATYSDPLFHALNDIKDINDEIASRFGNIRDWNESSIQQFHSKLNAFNPLFCQLSELKKGYVWAKQENKSRFENYYNDVLLKNALKCNTIAAEQGNIGSMATLAIIYCSIEAHIDYSKILNLFQLATRKGPKEDKVYYIEWTQFYGSYKPIDFSEKISKGEYEKLLFCSREQQANFISSKFGNTWPSDWDDLNDSMASIRLYVN